MKHLWLLVVVVFLATLPIARSAYATSSENLAKDMVKAAQKGDLASFQKHMGGPMLSSFGTNPSMSTIQQRAVSYKKISAKERLIGSQGHLRIYEVDVFGERPRYSGLPSKALLVTVQEQCSVTETYSPGWCSGWGPGWGWGRRGWGVWGTCFPSNYFQTEDCVATGLRE